MTDAELLADLQAVGRQTGRTMLSQTNYDDLGRYSFITCCRRFGSWKNALARVGLEPCHLMNVTTGELLDEIRRVAALLNTRRLRFNEFIEHGKYSRKVINRLFGRWQSAAEAAGLVPVIYRPTSKAELFINLKKVERQLRRRLRYEDLKPPRSRFGASVYAHRFGTFCKAMAAYRQWQQAGHMTKDDPSFCSAEDRSRGFHRRTSPRINLRLRYLTLQRDRFCCCRCGRSPALHLNVSLEVEHVLAWENGGETTMSNLQTLCKRCSGKISRTRKKPNR